MDKIFSSLGSAWRCSVGADCAQLRCRCTRCAAEDVGRGAGVPLGWWGTDLGPPVTGSGIVEALIRAKERDIDVRLIADKTTPCERGSGIQPLAAAGVLIWIDDQAKTMVIDGAVTLAGSMNWTDGAARNSKNVNLISSPAVAAAYATHWRERLTVSVRFERREDWCRSDQRKSGSAHVDE
jgi:hypothetical protein